MTLYPPVLNCHPRYSDRPARRVALTRLIEHIAGHAGVRFTRYEEVAAPAVPSDG